jgi:hypothetical protein
VLDQEGNSAAVVLDEDGFWQQHDLALLDFEDGQGACSNGTTATNIRLSGRVRSGSYEGLRFTVGVPFDRNHSDPLTALPPLGPLAPPGQHRLRRYDRQHQRVPGAQPGRRTAHPVPSGQKHRRYRLIKALSLFRPHGRCRGKLFLRARRAGMRHAFCCPRPFSSGPCQ